MLRSAPKVLCIFFLVSGLVFANDHEYLRTRLDSSAAAGQEGQAVYAVPQEEDAEIPDDLKEGYKRKIWQLRTISQQKPEPKPKSASTQKYDKYASLKGGLLGATLGLAASTLTVLLSGSELNGYVQVNFPVALGLVTVVLLTLWLLARHYLN